MTPDETAFTVFAFLWAMTAFLAAGVLFAVAAIVLMWRNR